MKLPVVCFPFVGNLVGGSHLSATGLIAALDRSRFEPRVVLQTGHGAIAELLSRKGIPFEIAPATPPLAHGRPVGVRTALTLLAAAPRLARFLRRGGVDIVHCNDGRTLATWALPARLAGAKLLWHHRGSPRSAGLRYAAPLLASKVVAVSRFAAPSPGRFSAHSRTHVIHSPFDVDTAYDRAAARTAVLALLPDSSAETRIVGFSGVLIERKRPLLFVEAIARMRRLAPDLDIRGVLFGEALDGMDARVAALARDLGVGGHIHPAGFRQPGPFWLAGCDMLMVPAVDEPFGRTLIEAMLVGTPVVATASGGNVEAIRHDETGRLVAPEDSSALAGSACDLLRDPDARSRLAAAARREAASRYGSDAHAAAVMSVYDDMLAASSGVRPPVSTHPSPAASIEQVSTCQS